MTSILQVSNISKSFGGVQALDDVNLTLNRGELLALIGPNGAGKSTLFNIINGQTNSDSGIVTLNGNHLTKKTPQQICKLGVARTFQIAHVFRSFTVQENIQMALLASSNQIFSITKNAALFKLDRAHALLNTVGLSDQANRACQELTYGDIKRVELAMALATEPSVLLMDEPTAGMGSLERNELIGLVKQLVMREELAVLFTEHSMDVIFAYADRLIVLARGKLIAQGLPQDVRKDPLVQAAYFGAQVPH